MNEGADRSGGRWGFYEERKTPTLLRTRYSTGIATVHAFENIPYTRIASFE